MKGKEFKEWRKSHYDNQQDAAEALDVTRKCIYENEAKEGIISSKLAKKVAALLEKETRENFKQALDRVADLGNKLYLAQTGELK
jgi:DNA-binding XRE family transcriptional regulator